MTSDSTYSTSPPGLQAQIINDLLDLFRSNNRGYGVGEFSGATFNEDKKKWYPGGVKWVWGKTEAQQWHDHLMGIRLLGQGVLCDDNKVWYACLDVDIYEIDYAEEMAKIKASGLPLVVFRTKSGGLRIAIFFSEPIEAELVIPRMRKVASQLGFAGCEIFPKQTKLDVGNGDCPSWIYVPFLGTNDLFPEQGCMTDTGKLMGITEAISLAKSKRLTKKAFLELFAVEDAAKANGKANGRKHPKGAWVQEESVEVTMNTMFCDGPPCLWTISHQGARNMQNNYLLNVATFLKRKYPENWDKALEWVNYNLLKPVGDREKLNGIIKRMKDHAYEYTCKDEPICNHCNPHACRRMPYGVGTGGNVVDYYELGLTAIDRYPRVWFVNVGENGMRIQLDANDLVHLSSFQKKCIEAGGSLPPTMKKAEWEKLVNKNIEEATIVPPSRIIRTNANELDTLATYFSMHVPNHIRYGDKDGTDRVRVRMEERRIYFKEQKLLEFCRRAYAKGIELAETMRWFIHNNCEHHDQGPGYRDWWRSTYSISFDRFDEETIEGWIKSAEDDSRWTDGQG